MTLGYPLPQYQSTRRNRRRYSTNEEKIYASARKLGYPFIGNLKEEDQLTIALVTEVHQGEFYHHYLMDSTTQVRLLNLM